MRVAYRRSRRRCPVVRRPRAPAGGARRFGAEVVAAGDHGWSGGRRGVPIPRRVLGALGAVEVVEETGVNLGGSLATFTTATGSALQLDGN